MPMFSVDISPCFFRFGRNQQSSSRYQQARASSSDLARWIASLWILLFGVVVASAQLPVVTNHYDNARTGQNTQETILTQQNVALLTQFGVAFTQPVDGNIYGQPLYMPNVAIPNNGTHNVVFVVTEGDSIYAFDADSNTGANASPLWHASLLDAAHGAQPGATTVSNADVGCDDLVPQIGITSTPVIDPNTNTLYVEAKSKENGGFVHRLHALDITTGNEKFSGPVVITGTVPGNGTGSVGGTITFDPLIQHNRPGLLLSNGVIYIAFASHCDNGPYHGWLFAYNASILAQKAVYLVTPNGAEGGIWMSGNGPAADASGNIFLSIGNGDFDNSTQLSDSLVKLTLSGSTLAPVDWFTPHTEPSLNGHDNDLGSGGPVLLPDQSGAHPHLLVAGPGKDPSGNVYLVDRDSMTDGTGIHFCICSPDPQIVQEIQGTISGQMWSSPTYWNNTVFFWATEDKLKAYSLTNGALSTSPIAQSPEIYHKPGANVSVSSNNTNNGIVWSVQPATSALTLRAHNATNLSLLYSTDQNRDICNIDLQGPVKFSVPTVANGKVYIGTLGEMQVYGFSSQTTPACGVLGFIGQFSCDPNGGFSGPCDTGTIQVTVNNTTETIRYDGLGFFTGTGFNNGNPGIPQTVAQTLVSAFNNDPSSSVTASLIQDTLAGGYDVKFTSKGTGAAVNYPGTITVTSDFGNFQVFGQEPVPFQWSWSPIVTISGVGADPATFTQATPLSGNMQGGRGPAPGALASLAPIALSFANQLVGNASSPQSVILTNAATATSRLTISSIGTSGDYAQTNNCPATLAVGTSCTISVTFSPTATGTRNGALTVRDNAANSPQTASLTGTGTTSAACLSPASLTFASQITGTTSAAKSVTLTSCGTATLSNISIGSSGDFAQTSNCPGSLPVNGTCTINVTFTPTATGTRTGSVTINDNAPGSQQSVSLSGTGVSQATGILAFSGQFSCQDSLTCDSGTISVTVNTMTKTISYDGTGFFTGTGYSASGAPGIPQTLAQTIVNAFNGDPNSPVTASIFQDTYLNGYDIKFLTKQAGAGVNYPTSITVTSVYGNFQMFGPATIGWTWTPLPSTGGADPTTLTEVTPLTGSLSGGH